MQYVNNLFFLGLLVILGMTSCQKEVQQEVKLFEIEDFTGRYVFDIELETVRDGQMVIQNFESVGYVTKESDYSIKILFDYAAPKVNCVYEYAVRPDGSFYSLYRGAGDREGQFTGDHVDFSEIINLGEGNYKSLDFSGLTKKD